MTAVALRNFHACIAELNDSTCLQIEAAYDALLMQNMRARLSGQMDVKNSVRFADVKPKKTVGQVRASVLVITEPPFRFSS